MWKVCKEKVKQFFRYYDDKKNENKNLKTQKLEHLS